MARQENAGPGDGSMANSSPQGRKRKIIGDFARSHQPEAEDNNGNEVLEGHTNAMKKNKVEQKDEERGKAEGV